MSRQRLLEWVLCAFALCLNACSGTTNAAGHLLKDSPTGAPTPWELAMDKCRISTDPSPDGSVNCPALVFGEIMKSSLDLHNGLLACFVSIEEKNRLCAVSAQEYQGEINVLDDKLGKWYRNPWIWLGISLGVGAVGFGVGFGLAK